MAARRLIAVLLVVLIVSTVAVAVVAPREQASQPADSTDTAPPSVGHDPDRAGRLIEKAVQAPSRNPSRLRLLLGDQLELTVRTDGPTQVEIPGLGMLEHAAPGAPAHFSVLAAWTGHFPVRALGSGEVTEISVQKPPPATKPDDGSPGARAGSR